MKTIVDLVRDFRAQRSGSIVIPFALTIGFVLLVVGAGLDYSRASNTRVVLQAAVDATALAANYDSEGLAEAKVRANAIDYFKAIYKGDPDDVNLDVTVEQGTVTVSATQAVQTLFGGILNVDKVDVGVRSETVIGKATFDVVMVLDNSGSMGGSKLKTLKDASEDLSKTLFAINEKGDKKDRVKIGLVPFTSFVNIGTDKETESWMDREGQSPEHWSNFETRDDGTPDPAEMESQFFYNGKPSRFTLFKQLKHTKWLGCVEARPVPYDVTDDAPDKRVPATLYVPEFAPDEPDGRYTRWGDRHSNDYIRDDSGGCRDKASKKARKLGKETHVYAQERMCKYRNQNRSFGNTYTKGPNYTCRTQPLTDLTTDKNAILRDLKDMKANGNTNIHQGVVWGWRVLSPQAPFTKGRVREEDSDDEHVRILIVMTDGANTYQGQNSFNKTNINAYGYGREERLGSGIDSTWEIARAMDQRTALACANAKNDGINVYTVAFRISDRDTVNMMRNCASNGNMAFDARSNDDLVSAFKRIAEEISKLRLNK
ncbi:VWA domain-containing protein [Stappia sp. ES.058]|uniref:VWA domain-containing protein n=1 Tax=Stappia sp. ES.058 TaxID=1881061 RepID=UPI00087DAF73|nr:VWA domain-containing protein [Stappia sp. ES.058]SDT91343.1 Flp pilus assembly protein TadG [Stappia sp. ES.058]